MEVKHMAKYRIKVEALDPADELRAEYRMGIECEGFTIIGDVETGVKTAMHDMSVADLAIGLASEADLFTAACMARGLVEGDMYRQTRKREKALKALDERLEEMMGED